MKTFEWINRNCGEVAAIVIDDQFFYILDVDPEQQLFTVAESYTQDEIPAVKTLTFKELAKIPATFFRLQEMN